jgi:hypothetical protein
MRPSLKLQFYIQRFWRLKSAGLVAVIVVLQHDIVGVARLKHSKTGSQSLHNNKVATTIAMQRSVLYLFYMSGS